MRDKDIDLEKIRRVTRKAKKPEQAVYAVSVQGMCEEKNMTAFFNVIRNRIYDELEQDVTMGDYVRINMDNLEDIFLDDKGVFMFSDILMGYFREEQIINLWKYLNELNRPIYTRMSIRQAIENYDTKKLKEMLQQYKEVSNKAPQEDYKEASQLLIDMITKELKKRRSLWQRVVRV